MTTEPARSPDPLLGEISLLVDYRGRRILVYGVPEPIHGPPATTRQWIIYDGRRLLGAIDEVATESITALWQRVRAIVDRSVLGTF